MPTRVEKDIRQMSDKDLLNYIYVHIDRAQAENAGVSKNLHYQGFEKTEEGRRLKLFAAMGYSVDQMEHLVNLRFAVKEMHLRLLRSRRSRHKMAVQFTKLRGERSVVPETQFPDIYNLNLLYDPLPEIEAEEKEK